MNDAVWNVRAFRALNYNGHVTVCRRSTPTVSMAFNLDGMAIFLCVLYMRLVDI